MSSNSIPGPSRRVYRNGERAWVGDCPQDATEAADVPDQGDARWQSGKPTALDVRVLTLSPFYPSGRLGACVESKASNSLFRNVNHPSFEGVRAWMDLDALSWQPIRA